MRLNHAIYLLSYYSSSLLLVYGWITQASFPSHVGAARKWHENEATVLKIGGLVASFSGHVGGAREWPENEATSPQTFSVVASFPGHVGGARKWPDNEATALKVCGLVASFPGHVGGARSGLRNWEVGCSQGCELVVRVRKTPMHV